jgi:hypothetical protein
MGIIKNSEIRGYHFSTGRFTEVVCLDCVDEEDLEDLKEDDILTEKELEEDDCKFFCNRCREKI